MLRRRFEAVEKGGHYEKLLKTMDDFEYIDKNFLTCCEETGGTFSKSAAMKVLMVKHGYICSIFDGGT
jgi:hypothetical protein